MIRKISSKHLAHEDKAKRLDNKAGKDNEYYLPHPQVKLVKINHKEPES